MLLLQLHDIVGLIGVAAILWAYFLLQTGRVAPEARRFSVLNGLGAALVLVSLYFEFNLSAFVIESFWLVFSVIGLVRAIRARRRIAGSENGPRANGGVNPENAGRLDAGQTG